MKVSEAGWVNWVSLCGGWKTAIRNSTVVQLNHVFSTDRLYPRINESHSFKSRIIN